MSRVISGLVAILFWSSVAARPGAPAIPPPPGFLQPPPSRRHKTGTAVHSRPCRSTPHRSAAAQGAGARFIPELARTGSPRRTPTAAYEIKDLAAGRYQLNASKGSFVQLQYGQPRPFEPGKPLEVLDGQTIEKVDFSAAARRRHHRPHPRRVRRADVRRPGDGDALPVRPGPAPADARRAAPSRRTTSASTGSSRCLPGSTSCRPRCGNLSFDAASDDRSGYAPTYYPNGASIADAQRDHDRRRAGDQRHQLRAFADAPRARHRHSRGL